MSSKSTDLERAALELLERALSHPAEEREAFIRKEANGDGSLEERALRLLRTDPARLSPFVTGGAEKLLRELSMPEFIGPYRVLKTIGEGGMGSVYLGSRPDEDFDHPVALKLIQSQQFSEEALRRFKSERRTLAKLKHPNIAQMYDGGETKDGTPYLAMEYVEGRDVSALLNEEAPTLDVRLDIFEQVCVGIAYAHRNLIAHRDLSPSNVLISKDGQTKIIDFGISYDLDDADDRPKYDRSPKTSGFSAPEKGQESDSHTSLDVFSLGALLDYLIRGVSAPRTADLANIIEKAKAEAPADRYESVDALLRDLRAYRACRPVTARSNNVLYRLRRFLGRRPLSLTAISIAITGTVLASIIMTALYARATVSEARAEARFQEVRQLANYFVFELDDELARLDGATETRAQNFDRAVEYLDSLQADPLASDDMKLELAIGYRRLADVSGNAGFPNLGERSSAGDLLDTSKSLLESLPESRNRDPKFLSAQLEILLSDGIHNSLSNGNHVLAIERFQMAESIFQDLPQPSQTDLLNRARAKTALAYAVFRREDFEQAAEMAARAVDSYRDISDQVMEFDTTIGIARSRATWGEALAWDAYAKGDSYDAALEQFDASVERLQTYASEVENHPEIKRLLSISLLKRANTTCYVDAMRTEGVTDLERAYQLTKSANLLDPKNAHHEYQLGNILLQQSDCYFQAGQFDDANKAISEAVAMRSAQLRREPSNADLLFQLISTTGTQRWIQQGAGNQADACDTARHFDRHWQRYDREHGGLDNEYLLDQKTQNDALLAECG